MVASTATCARGAAGPRRSRRAMRTQMQRPQWRHPFYWAAFAVIGDGR